jgi:hypothetical protein
MKKKDRKEYTGKGRKRKRMAGERWGEWIRRGEDIRER